VAVNAFGGRGTLLGIRRRMVYAEPLDDRPFYNAGLVDGSPDFAVEL
jgi:hypothetical protein